MTWRELNGITVTVAVIAAAGAGVALGTTVLDDGDGNEHVVTPASREPLRKAPLLNRAQEPRDDERAPTQDPEAKEGRAAQLGFAQPGEFRVGTPERALASFMKAWRERRWTVMETWTAAESGPDARRSALRRRFGPFRLRGWRVVARSRAKPPGAFDFDVEVAYRTLLDPVLRRVPLDFRVARRTAAGEASATRGSWGVDPLPRLMRSASARAMKDSSAR